MYDYRANQDLQKPEVKPEKKTGNASPMGIDFPTARWNPCVLCAWRVYLGFGCLRLAAH